MGGGTGAVRAGAARAPILSNGEISSFPFLPVTRTPQSQDLHTHIDIEIVQIRVKQLDGFPSTAAAALHGWAPALRRRRRVGRSIRRGGGGGGGLTLGDLRGDGLDLGALGLQ